jgi:HK97 family phage portal protein
MVQKRSLFDVMFGWSRPRTSVSQLQMMSGYTPVFTPWSGNPYEADIVRASIDAIARNAAKLKARHVRKREGDIRTVGARIDPVLQVRANPNMNAYDFFYKLVTSLFVDNNAFAYPVWEGANLKAVWPINFTMGEFLEDDSNTIYIRFYFGNAKTVILPYSEVIHLRRHYYKNDLIGESNKPINDTLSTIHTTNEGIAQAVKTSANLRGILKYQGLLKDTDIEANRQKFVTQYLTLNNSGGVAALDAKAEYTELKTQPIVVDAKQMAELRDNVYRYFGINDKIVMGNYNEEEWNAFYESVIEPIAVQMSLEFTSKLFTKTERDHGNQIIFEANRLQYASTKTKIEVITTLIDRGMMSLNQGLEVFNLPPIEGGDKRIVSLNFVNADKADLYQVGESGGNEPTEPTEP